MPEMKVLVLGLPRTGTQSLADALTYLSVSPVYHMREVAKNAHQELWIAAIADNLTQTSPRHPWSRSDWDAILSTFSAVSDFPPSLFPTSLANAYPECLIIHTTRSFETWKVSMRDTIVHAHANRDPDRKSSMEGLANAYHTACWDDDFEKNGRAYFERHHDEVRGLNRDGRKFLEYHPGDGWEPLCEFLGVEVPDVPFPRSDDWIEYKKKTSRGSNEGKTVE